MAHPDVSEAAVVGLRHEKWQERPVAFVVSAAADLEASDIESFLKERVASWWLPDRYVFIEELPKTGTGKFDKKVLRKENADLLIAES